MKIKAEVISCPGNLGDTAYHTLEIKIEGFESPQHLIMPFPAVAYKSLESIANPLDVLQEIANRINNNDKYRTD